MSLVIILAIFLAIVLGYITRINIGLFAIAFSYILGCFFLNMKPGEVIALWPLKIFFVIYAVCLFYSFAMVNGTLEKLAEHLLYFCRNTPWLLPYATFFTATIIAGMGAGYYTVLAFMAPVTLILCQRTHMDLVLGALSVNYGALAGANFMSSQSGIIFRGLMTNAGIADNQAFLNATAIFVATFLLPLVVISGFIFIMRKTAGTHSAALSITRPVPFDRKQRMTLGLTLIMMAIVLALPLAQLFAPQNYHIMFLNSKIDIGLVASIFSVIALLLKLGDERKAIASLPWGTLIMICGMGMLISIAIKAGTIEQLASWIQNHIPPLLVLPMFCLIAATMSLFSSTLGVVTPALFPMVLPLATQLDINPMMIFVAIVLGSQATSISPFSSGGSLILGSAPNDETRNTLFTRLLLRAAPVGVGASLICTMALVMFV